MEDWTYHTHRTQGSLDPETLRQLQTRFLLTSPNIFLTMNFNINGTICPVVIELFQNILPQTCRNFLSICLGTWMNSDRISPIYNDSKVHRVVPDRFIMAGKLEGVEDQSIFGRVFDDECFEIKHDAPGMLGMANSGPNTNSCAFYITLKAIPYFDNRNVVFGQVVDGLEYIRSITELPLNCERPTVPCFIDNCQLLPRGKDLEEALDEDKAFYEQKLYSILDRSYTIKELQPRLNFRQQSKVKSRESVGSLFHRISKGVGSVRKTSIVCTLGQSTDTVEAIVSLIDYGMTVARIRLETQSMQESVDLVQKVKEALSRRPGKLCAIVIDTIGPRFRVGSFQDPAPIEFQEGATIRLVASQDIDASGEYVPVITDYKFTDFKAGDKLTLSASIDVVVVENHKDELVLKALNSGQVLENTAIKPHEFKLSAVTQKDQHDIQEIAFAQDVDFVSISYCSQISDVEKIRSILQQNNSNIKIIAKIETKEGIANLPHLLPLVDAVNICRGDLGILLNAEKVILAQKYITQLGCLFGKPVIISTQIMESMMKNVSPTRAEASDAANAIIDGAVALCLTNETSIGRHPSEVVSTVAKICLQAERALHPYAMYQYIQNLTSQHKDDYQLTYTEIICRSAIQTAFDRRCQLILAIGDDESIVRLVTKYHPPVQVLVVTSNEALSKQVALYRGCVPCLLPSLDGNMKNAAVSEGKRKGILADDDIVVAVYQQKDKQIGEVVLDLFSVRDIERVDVSFDD